VEPYDELVLGAFKKKNLKINVAPNKKKKYTVTPSRVPLPIWLLPHLAPIKVCEEKCPNLRVCKFTATNFRKQWHYIEV